jgi:hypothetical protein
VRVGALGALVCAVTAVAAGPLAGTAVCHAADADVSTVAVTFGGHNWVPSGWTEDQISVHWTASWSDPSLYALCDMYYKNRYTNGGGGTVGSSSKIRVGGYVGQGSASTTRLTSATYHGFDKTTELKPASDGNPVNTVSRGYWWYTAEVTIQDSNRQTYDSAFGESGSAFRNF